MDFKIKISLARVLRLLYTGLLLGEALVVRSQTPNVVAWGNNTFGQTNIPSSATNVTAVAAGWYHNLALRSDGSVISWGALADVPPEATNIIAIAAGASNSVAINADGSVLCWGDNSWGQTNVPSFPTNVVAVAGGDYHFLALLADSTVVAWGRNSYGQTNVPFGLTNVTAISAGPAHSMAMLDDGSVTIWGVGPSPLSRASTAYPKYYGPQSIEPVAMAAGPTFNLYLYSRGNLVERGSYSVSPPSSETNIVAIVASTNCCLALRSYGTIKAWGQGSATNVPSSATNVISMSAGLLHGVAAKGTGAPLVLSSPAYKKIVSSGNKLPLYAKAVARGIGSYQWLADGVPIAGATNPIPAIPAVWGNEAVNYQFVVSNALGCVTSPPANFVIKSINVWGDYRNNQTKIPISVIHPVSVAAGAFHCLALQPDGTVVAWGRNYNQQTNIPVGLSNVVLIAAGSDHSLALKADGSVAAWGKNLDHQTNVPASATNIIALDAGWAHSVALRADGRVIVWGNNDYDQCSISLLASEVVDIAAGYYHTLALKSDGSVVSWGYQVDVPASVTNISAIAAGWGHNLALRNNGTIVAWGDNTFGQSTVPPAATNVVAIAAGWYHSLALRADGTILSWGKTNKNNFITNPPPFLSSVVQIDCGEDYSVDLSWNGKPVFSPSIATRTVPLGNQIFLTPTLIGGLPMTYQWLHEGVPIPDATNRFLLIPEAQFSSAGIYALVVSNVYGQFTNSIAAFDVSHSSNYSLIGAWGGKTDTSTMTLPYSELNPIGIAAGDFHNLVLQSDGTVLTSAGDQTNVPPDLTNAVALAAGYYFNVALRADQSVTAWGRTNWGQTNVPAAATNVVAIAARNKHALALRSDGIVIAWGGNDFNQTNVPPDLTDVIAISAGFFHNLALRSDHRVVAWGAQSETPSTATNVIAIAAGFDHSLALKADGSVLAWGDNSFGQCSVPDAVTNALAVAAGWWSSAALLPDGQVIGWGQEHPAVTSSSNIRFKPVKMVPGGLDHVTQIACGSDHVLAMVTKGAPLFEISQPTLPAHSGQSLVLPASGGGSLPLYLQWYQDQAPIAGATNRWLPLSDVQTAHSGSYILVASNALGQSSSSALALDVRPEPYFLPPFPVQQNYFPGDTGSLSVPVAGEAPLSFQAQLDGVNLMDDGRISGANSPMLTFDPVTFADSGEVNLVVTNSYGSYTGLLSRVAVTKVLAWGDNSMRQCAVLAAATTLVALASGVDHNLALREDGTVVAWGDNSTSQNDLPSAVSNIVAIAEGDNHCLALKADGTILTWGVVNSLPAWVPVSYANSNAIAIAAGNDFSVALLPSGNLVQWGLVPPTIPASATNILMIAARGRNVLAVKAGFGIIQWGIAPQGMPSTLTNGTAEIVAIAPASDASLALLADGSVVAWGKNKYGLTNVPATAKEIVSIAAGEDCFIALRADGNVITWGNTNNPQLTVPNGASNIQLISAGSLHILAYVGQPLRQSAVAGQNVTFSGAQFARRLAAYQWQFNGADLPGETNLTLTLSNVYWMNSGAYRLIAKYPTGSISSPAMTLDIPALKLEVVAAEWSTSSNAFHLRLSGASGLNPVLICASSNLVDWIPIFTNPPTTGPIDFTDTPPADTLQKFYRAIEQP